MTLQPGQRLALLEMPEAPDPVEVGTVGTVREVTQHVTPEGGWVQIDVDWDGGRRLTLTVPPDQYHLVKTTWVIARDGRSAWSWYKPKMRIELDDADEFIQQREAAGDEIAVDDRHTTCGFWWD